MIKRWVIIIIVLLVLSVRADNLAGTFARLVTADNKQDQEKLIAEILLANPSPDTLIALIRGIKFNKPESTGIIWGHNLCIDGVTRPFYWYVPKNYDPAKKTPLVVWLHGGIRRQEINPSLDWLIKDPPIRQMADEHAYILLFPLGQAGATWWDPVGVANILDQVRATKRKFNIDDNRVYMSGFSDGASGSFFFAMTNPTDFAGFMPLNGHPAMASIAGGVQMYLSNLSNRPLSVVNTDLDQHYPAKEMQPIMELAQKAGADLRYRVYTGIGHDFVYAPKEMPVLVEFMQTHPRIVEPPVVTWETAYPGLGRCMWLAIEAIAVDSIRAGSPAPWYQDFTDSLFRRDLPSARAEASFLANRFTIRGSQLGAFSIYIDPAMVQLDQNVVVTVDGKEVFNKKVTANPKFILENFLTNRDRELLYVNKISLNLSNYSKNKSKIP